MKASIPSGAAGILSSVAESAFAAGVGFLASGILLAAVGHDPIKTFESLLVGSFGSVGSFAFTLDYAAPVTLTALTFAVGVRAGLFNIGAEGQVYAGGAAAVAVSLLAVPTGFGLPMILVASALAGAAWALPPFLLKAYRGVNEVISTIMMNQIALLAMQFVVLNYLLDPARSDKTVSIPAGSRFPLIVAPSFSIVIFFSALVCLAVYYYLWQTPGGYELRSVGLNPDAAKFGGIKPKKAILYSFLLGGITAGLAGAVQVAGTFTPYAIYTGLSNLTAYGVNGIGVALIGRNHPVAIVGAGIFFGALQAGASTVQITGVSFEIVQVIEGMIIFAIAAPELYRIFRRMLK
ncbi:MAG: ABC transporter permease [Nitrososphaerales archaeon]|nr:ABC transporter permease [Nitrososphaerales archaeon]